MLSANVVGGASNASQITFYSSLTDAPNVTPNEVTIALTGGALKMYTYPYEPTGTTGATSANSGQASWTWSTTPTDFTLLPYAATATINSATQPVFELGTTTPATRCSRITIGGNLTSAQADRGGRVTINFEALPSDDYRRRTAESNFTDTSRCGSRRSPRTRARARTPCT